VTTSESPDPMAGSGPELRNLSTYWTSHNNRHDRQAMLCCFWPCGLDFQRQLQPIRLWGSMSIRHSTDFQAVPTGSGVLVVRMVGTTTRTTIVGTRSGVKTGDVHPPSISK